MNKLKVIVLVSLTIFIGTAGFSQANMQRFMLDPSNMSYISHGGAYYLNQAPLNKEIEGTPYLFEDWVNGKIVSDKNEELVNCKVRYDASHDIFEVRINNDQSVRTLNTKRIKSITAGADEFIVSGDQYFQMLEKGKYSLLKKYKAELKEEHYVAGLSSKHENPTWKISSKYYVMDTLGMIKPFGGRKELLNALNKADDKELDKTARKTDFSDEKKLKELMQWINNH